MTVSSAALDSAEEEAVHFGDDAPRTHRAEARPRVGSVAKEQPAALSDATGKDTERDGTPAVTRVQEAAQEAADRLTVRATQWFTSLSTRTPVWHVRPLSLAQAWEHGQAAVNHYDSMIMRVLRAIWLIVYVTFIAAVAYPLCWILMSFPRVLVACVLGWIISVYI